MKQKQSITTIHKIYICIPVQQLLFQIITLINALNLTSSTGVDRIRVFSCGCLIINMQIIIFPLLTPNDWYIFLDCIHPLVPFSKPLCLNGCLFPPPQVNLLCSVRSTELASVCGQQTVHLIEDNWHKRIKTIWICQ
jgi:hypothetical protein